MFKITATGARAQIELAWDALAWADPSPAGAVDAKEETHTLWRLDAIAETREDALKSAEIVAAAVPALKANIEPLEDRDWVKLSLAGLPPVKAGRFVVAGGHVLANAAPGKTSLLVEAGPAFGTGHHGTTLGCLLAFDRLLKYRKPGRVLDLGTGTGLLAIAALKAGADFALATDVDSNSVITARQNAAANDATARFQAIEANGFSAVLVHRRAPYDLVFANILARPLVGLAHGIAKVTAPGGAIILSGLLTHQEPMVRAAYAGRGLILQNRLRRDGWSTLVFRRPGRMTA
ncbi:MAG: 50S ribosomal protein L11 methyltransferase [Pseudomonadota bacterium]